MISWSMLSIEKKSSANNEDTSTISQNLSGSLSKPRNFIGDGSICKERMWQHISNHLKFLPVHYEVISWHHAKFQVFQPYFSFPNFRNTKVHISFELIRVWLSHVLLHAYPPADFPYISHLNVWKAISNIFKLIYGQLVQIFNYSSFNLMYMK